MPRHASRLAALLAGLLIATAVPMAAQAADSDKDGLTDAFETKWGLTDPNRKDTDRDGVIAVAVGLLAMGLITLARRFSETARARSLLAAR